MTQPKLIPVAPGKACKLLNLGGTVLVSAEYEGKTDMMPASWNMPLDYDKGAVVIDSTHYTRPLMDNSKYFALGVAGEGILPALLYLGSVSKNDAPEKLEKSGMKFFKVPGYEMPLAEGCSAWVILEKLPEPEMSAKYDLFLGRVVAAWANADAWKDDGWNFEEAPAALRPTYYTQGGRFYVMGEAKNVVPTGE